MLAVALQLVEISGLVTQMQQKKPKGSKQLIFQSPPNRHRTAAISGHANVAAGCRSEVKGFVQRYEPLSLPIPPVLNCGCLRDEAQGTPLTMPSSTREQFGAESEDDATADCRWAHGGFGEGERRSQ